MVEASLSPELGFKPGTTKQEYRKQAWNIFRAVQREVPFLRGDNVKSLFGKVVDAYIKDSDLNNKARAVMVLGLTVARLEERRKEARANQKRGLLRKRCEELGGLLSQHISEVPSVDDLVEAAIQFALAIQASKKERLREEKCDSEEKRKGKFSLAVGEAIGNWIQQLKGDLKPGCLVGLIIFMAIAVSTGALADEVVSKGRVRRLLTGERKAAVSQQEVDLNQRLRGEAYNLLVTTLQMKDPAKDAYLKEVWGISTEEIDTWREKNPKPSSEKAGEFAKRTLTGKDPKSPQDYIGWYTKVWRAKTPTPGSTP